MDSKQCSQCSKGRLLWFSLRISLISSTQVSGMQFLARASLRMFSFLRMSCLRTRAPLRLMQLFSSSSSSRQLKESWLQTSSCRTRQLSEILQELSRRWRRDLFLASITQMKDRLSPSISFFDKFSSSRDRLPSMPSPTNFRSFSRRLTFERLSRFSPQFLLKQNLMWKNLSPSPKGLSSSTTDQRVLLAVIHWQKYSNPAEVMALELRLRQLRFIEMAFLLQETPRISAKARIPESEMLFLERSSFMRGNLAMLWAKKEKFLGPISFLLRLMAYRVLLQAPSKASFIPSLPSSRLFIFKELRWQFFALSSELKFFTPSLVILFLLRHYPEEILSLYSEGSSLRARHSWSQPQLPMPTEASDSSFSISLGITRASFNTPKSPRGLLSSTIF